MFRPKISQDDPGDAGWGIMTGIAAPGSVRGQFPNGDELATIIERATALRGGVVGDGPGDVQRRDLLDDVLHVFADTGRPRLQWDELAALLAAREPDVYGDITAEAISSSLRTRHQVPTIDVKKPGERTARKGCERKAVAAAIEARAITAGPS